MLEAYFRRLSDNRDYLELKYIYNGKILVTFIAATNGRFYELVGVFLEKCPMDVSRGNLS